jgi:hypothetical protein
MQIHSAGIDPGKTTFHLVAVGAAGKALVRKKFSQQLLAYTANVPMSLIGWKPVLKPTFWAVPCVRKAMTRG